MMAVMRINKTEDYTIMSNAHFKEKKMSLKAKGLLSLMLSLPDTWDYSIAGLVTLSKDGKDSVMNSLDELEKFGYLIRTKLTDDKGRFAGYDYDIYESPQTEKPCADNPNTDRPNADIPQQLNTNQSNIKKLNNNQSNTNKNIIIDENFEKLWKMLKSTPYDRKSKVTKKRKKELYEMGAERAEKAIQVYLQVQNPNYYHKRDNFLNEIIENYLDKEAKDFANGGTYNGQTNGNNGEPKDARRYGIWL